jgi:E3 ubiquitin-protein ligase SHPRH
MHQLLTQSLKNDGDADGDEYSRSLDAQGEADMYLQAYTALMADRRATLIAERTLLAEHDGKEKKLRKTKAARAAAAAAMAIHGVQNPEISEDFELRPEHEVLFKDLTNARRALLEDFNGRAIKSIMCVIYFCQHLHRRFAKSQPVASI